MEQAISWKFFERFIVSFIQFVIILVLVRFVSPNEMGIAIICLAIFHIVNSLSVNWLSNILIQKDEVDELDYSTTLISQLVLATIFYSLLYGSTSILASWLQLDVIVIALRILGVSLFFYAMSSLYTAHMIRTANYRSLFFISAGSAFIAAILCFFLAIFQYGLFAVLLWTFFYQLFSVLLMILFYIWRPKIRFSYQRLSDIVTGGWKLTVTSIVDVLFRNGQLVAIGQFFNPAALSFYVRGERFPGVFVQQYTHVTDTTFHPILAKVKDDSLKLHLKMREIIVLSGFVIFPLLTILFVTAEPLILSLFGESWLMVVPFIQIFCIYYGFVPVASVFTQALTALDSTEKLIKMDFIKKGVLLLLWGISFPFGVQAVAGSMIIFIFINLLLTNIYLKKYIDYSLAQVLKDSAPALLLSCTMGVLNYILHFILPSSILLIVFQFVLGALFYGSLAYYFKLQGWQLFVKVAHTFYGRFSRIKSPTL